MDRNQPRIVFGLLSTVVAFSVFGVMFPHETGVVNISLVLLRMSFHAAVACAIGGYIAGDKFVVPAMILAALTWFATTAYSMYIGAHFDDVSFDRLLQNLPFAILVPASAIGAKFGMMAAAWRRRSAGVRD